MAVISKETEERLLEQQGPGLLVQYIKGRAKLLGPEPEKIHPSDHSDNISSDDDISELDDDDEFTER